MPDPLSGSPAGTVSRAESAPATRCSTDVNPSAVHPASRFVQSHTSVALRVDVSNIAEVLDLLDDDR